MSQDFAKHKQGKRPRKAPASRHTDDAPARGRGLRLYLGGVLTGIFISFIGYLTTLPDPTAPASETVETEPPNAAPKPRFDFYTMLPEQKLEVEDRETVEPAADVSKPTTAAGGPESYLLQAGSFRQREDAERRRAELLLLGLEPKIEDTTSDTGRWFRVYLGPFESHEKMTQARGLTANQNIETLVLKRGGA